MGPIDRSTLFSSLAFILLGACMTSAQAPGYWAWMGGNQAICSKSPCTADAGVYGTEYQFAPGNQPGARSLSVTWTDAAGRFWLFGGRGVDSAGNTGDLNDLWVFDPAQGAHGEWAWMGGNPTMGQPGVYGAEYQSSAAGVPGARNSAAMWTDKAGRVWLFGGDGFDSAGRWGRLNDFWVFDPAAGEHGLWAWMGGTNTFTGCFSLCAAQGVYGTEYQFASTNIPSGRGDAICWTDGAGRFWLYSGSSVANDLWVFDPAQGANGEWAWMGGRSLYSEALFGAEYQFAPSNWPGDRQESAPVFWKDLKGNLWVFGGGGYALGAKSTLDDLWAFDATQGPYGEWAWMGGSSLEPVHWPKPDPSVYGTEYQFAPANLPGGRISGTGWTDKNGRLWLLGGNGVGASLNQGWLNDLWVFDPAQGAHGEWAWVGGNRKLLCTLNGCTGRPPVFGNEYEFAPTNDPGGRESSLSWTDANGNLWLFGGQAYDAAGNFGYAGDIWEYRLRAPQTVSFPKPAASFTYGQAPVTLAATSSSGLPVTFKLIVGPAQLSGIGNSTLSITGSAAAVGLNAVQPGDLDFLPASAQETVWVFRAPLTVTADNKIMQYGSSVPALTWTAGGFVNGETASVLTGAPALSTVVTSTTPPGKYAITTARGTLAAANYTVIPKSGTLTVRAFGTVASPTFTLAPGTYNGAQLVTIQDATPGATIFYTTDGLTPLTPVITQSTAFGDSITMGTQDSSTPWPAVAQQILGHPVNNHGITGQTSGQICARMSACPTYVTSTLTIPTSGSVAVNFKPGYEPCYNTQLDKANPYGVLGTIAGVTGYCADNGAHVYTFTPTVYPASPVPVSAGTPWTPELGNAFETGTCINIEAGRNNILPPFNPSQTLADIKDMVAFAQAHTDCWSIMTITSRDAREEWKSTPYYNTIQTFNSTLATLYGSHVVDIRTGLIADYDPSNPLDVADHTNDVTPYSLRADRGQGKILAGIADATTCAFTTSGNDLLEGMLLHVENEYILLNGGANGAWSCTRGWQSTASAHPAGVTYDRTDDLHPGHSAPNPNCISGPACIAQMYVNWLTGTKYTGGAIHVTTSQTVKAIAVEPGYTPSAVASATYTIH